MPRARRTGSSGNAKEQRGTVKGCTLRGRNGRINYVGITNNPERRAKQLRNDGKSGTMKIETKAISRKSARWWETNKLANYRRTHGGDNPRHNQTRSGGWKG